MICVFLPCDDGKLENEGLKVEENGRLVQRDVTSPDVDPAIHTGTQAGCFHRKRKL